MQEYRIVEATSSDKLQEQVNFNLKHGYKLVGGVAFVNKWYAQAMIRTTNEHGDIM